MKRIIGMFFLAAVSRADDVFQYRVERDQLIRDQVGELRIASAGISYRSDNGKTTLRIALSDVLEADVSDSRVIRVKTYDILKRNFAGRRVYTFRLLEGKHDEALTRFLAANLQRPVIGSYGAVSPEAPTLSAYHRHRLGGCHGKLQIDSSKIRFVSDKSADSRTWLYSGIETVGSMNPFHFRVTSLAETYNFDLKERLPEQLYELTMRSAYRLTGRKTPAGKPDLPQEAGGKGQPRR